MPTYAYRCADCGPFDERRALAQATLPAVCPVCGGPAARAYTPPGVRSAAGAGASRSDRGRIDRARTGEPTVTGPPTGARRRTAHVH